MLCHVDYTKTSVMSAFTIPFSHIPKRIISVRPGSMSELRSETDVWVRAQQSLFVPSTSSLVLSPRHRHLLSQEISLLQVPRSGPECKQAESYVSRLSALIRTRAILTTTINIGDELIFDALQ